MTTPAVAAINSELWRRWTRGLGPWAHLDDFEHCGWPQACHGDTLPPMGRAAPEERALGIPAGTFAAIRRLWRPEIAGGPLPAMWVEP